MDNSFPLIGVLMSFGFGSLAILFLCLGFYAWPMVEWSSVAFGSASFLCTIASIMTLANAVDTGSASGHAVNLAFHPNEFALILMVVGGILWFVGLCLRLFPKGRLDVRLLGALSNALGPGYDRRRW